MGNIGMITSTGKQNVGGNQNNLKIKYIKYNVGELIRDKIGVLVDDSVTDRATLIDYMSQNGALGEEFSSDGKLISQYRSIICCYAHHRRSAIISYPIVTINRSFNSESQEWGNWEDLSFRCIGGSYNFTISGNFDVID